MAFHLCLGSLLIARADEFDQAPMGEGDGSLDPGQRYQAGHLIPGVNLIRLTSVAAVTGAPLDLLGSRRSQAACPTRDAHSLALRTSLIQRTSVLRNRDFGFGT